MATASLMDYLAGDALTKLAQAYAVRPGLPRPFPAPFYAPGPNKPVGTAIKYDLLNGSRESAKVSNPDAPSQAAQGIQTDQKKIVAIGSREHYVIGLDLIQALQYNGDLVRMNAQMELQRQLQAFVDRFVNIETNAVHSALIRGKIDVGSDGAIQTSTSSPVRTLDYSSVTGVTLTTAGAGSSFAIGDWATAATDIITNIKTLKRQIARDYGFRLTDCYYGVNVPNYLAKNTVFKEYLARFPMFRDQFSSTGEIPDGVLGLRWHAVDIATTVSSGSATSWAGDDFIAFSPDPADTGWYEMVQCGLPCPSGLVADKEIRDAMLSPESLGAAFPIKYGIHSYTLYSADPISAKLVCANFSAPIVKSPNVMPRGVCH
jgi:hypothetical protein